MTTEHGVNGRSSFELGQDISILTESKERIMKSRKATFSRLTFGVRILIAAFVLMSALASVRFAEARSCDPCPVVTSDDLNLRAGPGKKYSVKMVIPKGTQVVAYNSQTNGYSEVQVGGVDGWAYRQYLVSPDSPAVTGTMVTMDYLNFRKSPGSSGEIMEVLPPLALVEVTGQIVNAYRFVHYHGMQGWVYNGYLASSSTMKTTDAVNLRSKPSVSSKIKRVLPAGTKVQLTGSESEAFVSVKVNGVSGWVYMAYLI